MSLGFWGTIGLLIIMVGGMVCFWWFINSKGVPKPNKPTKLTPEDTAKQKEFDEKMIYGNYTRIIKNKENRPILQNDIDWIRGYEKRHEIWPSIVKNKIS
jgi:hypothetical protein